MSRKKPTEKVVEEIKEEKIEETTEKVEEAIDPKVKLMLALNRKDKISEKDKQSKIYSAMANIQIERR